MAVVVVALRFRSPTKTVLLRNFNDALRLWPANCPRSENQFQPPRLSGGGSLTFERWILVHWHCSLGSIMQHWQLNTANRFISAEMIFNFSAISATRARSSLRKEILAHKQCTNFGCISVAIRRSLWLLMKIIIMSVDGATSSRRSVVVIVPTTAAVNRCSSTC